MRSRFTLRLATTRDGRKGIDVPAMHGQPVMLQVCSASLKPTDWTSMTGEVDKTEIAGRERSVVRGGE